MTERMCGTCAWWYRTTIDGRMGNCHLEPIKIPKQRDDLCRHHSFTTGWLEEENKEPDLAAKVKALSQRCKQARILFEANAANIDRKIAIAPIEINQWLAGEDE